MLSKNQQKHIRQLSRKKYRQESGLFVAEGEKLVGKFELIEVNKDEVIFRNDEKLYKIKNLVGK